MGCGWKRWSDEVGIAKLQMLLTAWEEKDTTFSKVMRGAVWKMQSEVGARRELVLNGRYRHEHNPRVHETWLGQLWRWMTRAELQVRLDGLSVRVAAGRRSIVEEAGRYSDTERELVQRGCDVLGVQWVTDLLCRDGQHVRPEMAVGGRTSAPWAGRVVLDGKDWCDVVRSRLGWTGNEVSPVPMPRPQLAVGCVVAYRVAAVGAPQPHQVRVGCVVDVVGGVASVMRAELGRLRSAFGLPAGGGIVDQVRIADNSWRVLDLAHGDSTSRILAWLQGNRADALALAVCSSEAHMQLRTHVAAEREEVVCSLPPCTEHAALRAQLEGLNLGCHSFVTDVSAFAVLAQQAAASGQRLLGFSDGSVTGDGNLGSYGWLVAVLQEGGGLRVLAAGGGVAEAGHNTNVLLNTKRMEGLGLAAGKSFARDWAGPVSWWIDNTGIIRVSKRLARKGVGPYGWTKMGDRDVAGYLEWLDTRVRGEWDVQHVKAHAEKRRRFRSEWTFQERGNGACDGIAERLRKAAAVEVEDWQSQVDRWNRQQDAAHETTGGERLVPKPVRASHVEPVPAWRLPSRRTWMLTWQRLEVVGPVGPWVRTTLQNSYSTRYMRMQSAGLFAAAPPTPPVSVGERFCMDGRQYLVKRTSGEEVQCGLASVADPGLWMDMDAAEVALLVHGDKLCEKYSPDPDVRLITRVWMGCGPRRRVRTVKYMWGLFACNDLLHRRFGKLSSGDCTACGAGHTEDPVHVIGACGEPAAAEVRAKFVGDMWGVIAGAMREPTHALDADLAQAIRRLWSMADDGTQLRQWLPGTLGPASECAAALDSELRRMYEDVARAGSWAIWMGVFSRSWLRLLRLGGMSYKRAVRVTRQLSRLIDAFRSDVARIRHDRARQVRDGRRAVEAERVLAEVRRLYACDDRPPCAVEVLESKGLRAQQRYVRRRGGEEFVRAHERAARQAKLKRRKKRRRKIVAAQAPIDMYFQPQSTWRRSVVVSSDESSGDEGEAGTRDNTDPRAADRVQLAIGRMQDRGVARREALARLRQARALTADKRRAGARQGATKRRRGGWRVAGRKRRRVISDSESDDDDGEDGGDDGEGTNPNNNECGGDEVARSSTFGSAATASRAATSVTAQQAGTREMSGPGRGAGAPTRRGGGGEGGVGSVGGGLPLASGATQVALWAEPRIIRYDFPSFVLLSPSVSQPPGLR